MKWIFAAVEVCMLAIFIYGTIRCRRVRNRLENVELAGLYMPIGRFLSAKMPIRSGLQKRLSQLYPSISSKELCREYQAKEVGQIFLMIMICNAVLLLGLKDEEMVRQVGYQLERPAYEEGDRQEVLIVENQQESTVVEVTIPHQMPTRTQAEVRLAEGKLWLERYIRDLGTVGASLQLPVQWEDVLITYTADDVKIGEDGYVRFREVTGPQKIKAELSCGEYNTQMQFELAVSLQENATLAEKIDEALQDAELTETELLLPKSLDSKVLSWRLPEQQTQKEMWILLLWALPFLTIPLGYQELNRKEKERQQKIALAYPRVIQKLTVFLGAGLSIQAAWERTALQGDRKDPLMEEMNVTRVQIRHGTPMQEALRQFGHRVRNPALRRLANMLCRNLRRGDEFLLEHLKEMNQMAWEDHKKTVKIQSEEAETKLLLPMILMLAVILLIVMTPAMLTMSS